MKFKLFKWEIKDGTTLEEYITDLEDRGWVTVGSTVIKTSGGEPIKVIISCYKDTRVV